MPVPGCVPGWPWPWLGFLAWAWPYLLTADLSGEWGRPQLMPLDLLCLLRGCRTVMLIWEIPAYLALPLPSPCLPGQRIFSTTLSRKNCCPVGLSVSENECVCLGGWTCGNMWVELIWCGIDLVIKEINCTDPCSQMVLFVRRVSCAHFGDVKNKKKAGGYWLHCKFYRQDAWSVLASKRRKLHQILQFLSI